MAEVVIRDATQEDVDYVADHLRCADLVEINLSRGSDAVDAVKMALEYSAWTKCAVVDGLPAVIYGVSATDIPECGTPWMLATDDIQKIKDTVRAEATAEVGRMMRDFPFLFNQVHKDNAVSIRWLRKLGFDVDPKPTGPCGQFLNFWKGVPNV